MIPYMNNLLFGKEKEGGRAKSMPQLEFIQNSINRFYWEYITEKSIIYGFNMLFSTRTIVS